MLRKTYAEVDLDCIAHNIRALRRAAGTPMMAVVKADAYGHGMQGSGPPGAAGRGGLVCRGDGG